MKEYDAYVFDLYGTLVDILTDEESDSIWTVFSHELRDYGVVCTPGKLKEMYHEKCLIETEKMERIMREKQLSGPAEIDILNVWKGIAQEHGIVLSETQLNSISVSFRKFSTRKIILFDGARELLALLKIHNRKLVLLTNAQASFTRQELHALDIGQMFDHIIISSECGVKKPSKDFYSRLWQFGLTPETSLMIGNDDTCDCWGAANVGMDSMYIRTEQSPELSGPLPENCRMIKSLTEIFP